MTLPLFSKKEGLITALVLVGVFLFSLNQIADFDFFYHLKTGQYIWQTTSVPLYDVFSYTAPGARWITHSWFFELILYGLYSLAGYWGIMVFVALAGAVTYALMLALGRLLGAPFPLLLLLLFPTAALSFELWVPRPQIFSYFFLVAEFFFLESFRRRPDWRKLLALEAIILLWANIHASVILGIAVALWYAVCELAKIKFNTLGIRLEQGAVRALVLAASGSAFVALLNPNTYEALFYFQAIRPVVEALGVAEWYSIVHYLYIPQAKLFIGLLLAIDALVVWRLVIRKESKNIGIAGVILGVSLLPFISIRHVGYLPLVGVPAVALALASFPAIRGFLEHVSDRKLRITLLAIALAIVVFGIIRLPKAPLNKRVLSLGAVDFIAEQGIAGPLFNMANEGSYIMWRLWPRIAPFIDGRSEVYRGRPIADFLTIVRQEQDWERLFDEEYKINAALFWYRAPLDRWMGPFAFKLLQKRFVLVYWDDAAVVMLRNTPENSRVIDSFGFRFINPFIPASRIHGVPPEAVAAEIQKALEHAPDSDVVRSYAEEFLAAQPR